MIIVIEGRCYLLDIFGSGIGVPIEDEQLFSVLGRERYEIFLNRMKSSKKEEGNLLGEKLW